MYKYYTIKFSHAISVLNSKGEKMNISWVKDPFSSERGEFERVANDFSAEHSTVSKGKVRLYTDPSYFGAEVDVMGFDSLPVVNISTDRLIGFEPDDKMNQPKSKANVEKIVAGLKHGAILPPLLVRRYKNGYQVLDGHHRFWSYKLLNIKTIRVRIVADKNIEEIDKQSMPKKFDYGKNHESLKANIKNIYKLYENATLHTLTKNTWSSLENTDSWDTTTIAKIQSAIKQNAGSSGSRNIENVLKEFFTGRVRAPIILQYDEGKSYTLIAGNTRLMIARMLDIPVKVVIIKSDW